VPVTLLVPRGSDVRQGTRHGVRIQVADLLPADVTHLHGVPITSPLRTGLDVARDLGRCRMSALIPLCGGARGQAALLMGGERCASAHDITERLTDDSALRATVLTALHEVIARVNARGMVWVRRVAGDVEPLIETALEGLAWAVLTASDLPRAEPQRVIAGRSGRGYRVDFLIAGRVILEADGAVKYADVTPWDEKQRQSDLEAAGYWVVRCSWEELIHRPHEVLSRIRVALARSIPR
jgi:very-short-patch-repair endonuclease